MGLSLTLSEVTDSCPAMPCQLPVLWQALSNLERYEVRSSVAAHVTQIGTNPKIAFVDVLLTVNGFAARVAQNRDAVVELSRNVPGA